MEFPITVQRLHRIGDEYRAMRKKEIVNKFVEKFTKDIIQKAWKSPSMNGVSEPPKDKRRYVVYGKDIDIDDCVSVDLVEFPKHECVPEIVVEMKKRFPDMVIIEDPLGTYILFDWN